MARSEERLREWAEAVELALPESFYEDVQTFYDALVQGNARMNLTRITDWDAYLVKHVIDSALAFVALPKLLTGRHRVADLGAGAGLPSVVLARANERLRVTAMDGTGKKMRWLQETATANGWENLQGVHGRAEDLGRGKPHAGNYDVVTARAVGPGVKVMRHGHQLVAPGGCMLLYKTSAQMEEEVAAVGDEAKKLGFLPDYSEIFELPGDAGTRAFWILRRA